MSGLYHVSFCLCFFFFFFFNDTATTEIYTLSLHDALPIFPTSNATASTRSFAPGSNVLSCVADPTTPPLKDRKSTRLNSSHSQISYAVFCLKKKKKKNYTLHLNDDNTIHTFTDHHHPDNRY